MRLRNTLLYLFTASFIILGNSCADKKDYLVTIETDMGDIKMILYDETPKHKENFLKVARSGQYDSTIFHRVIKNFMIQGGDVDAKEKNTGKQETIPAEFVDKFYHKKGEVAAARQPDQFNKEKASSWCQFYIVHGNTFSKEELEIDQAKFGDCMRQYVNLPEQAELREELLGYYQAGDMDTYQDKIYGLIPQLEQHFNLSLKIDYPEERLAAYTTVGGAPHLDGEYTIFGKVVEGLDVVDAIANIQTAPGDKPIEDIYMKVSVEEVSKKKITKEYGYEYPE